MPGTTRSDIYWAVTCEFPADQLPCSGNWGGMSHLFTQKKLWLREAWQGLPNPHPEPVTPQLGGSGGNCLAPSGFSTVYPSSRGTPHPPNPVALRAA